MSQTAIVVSEEQRELVSILNTLYQGYETAGNQSQVRTLIWSNLEQLKKQIDLDSKQKTPG